MLNDPTLILWCAGPLALLVLAGWLWLLTGKRQADHNSAVRGIAYDEPDTRIPPPDEMEQEQEQEQEQEHDRHAADADLWDGGLESKEGDVLMLDVDDALAIRRLVQLRARWDAMPAEQH